MAPLRGSPLNHVIGDASRPQGDGPRIIAHVVNDSGMWGAGFTSSLNKAWPEAGEDYRLWHRYRYQATMDHPASFAMGNVRYTCVEGGLNGKGDTEKPLWVAHMIAQRGTKYTSSRPLRYDALGGCLLKVSQMAVENNASVHMPRIGAGLAGGDWGIIQELLFDAFVRQAVPLTVYKLPPRI